MMGIPSRDTIYVEICWKWGTTATKNDHCPMSGNGRSVFGGGAGESHAGSATAVNNSFYGCSLCTVFALPASHRQDRGGLAR